MGHKKAYWGVRTYPSLASCFPNPHPNPQACNVCSIGTDACYSETGYRTGLLYSYIFSHNEECFYFLHSNWALILRAKHIICCKVSWFYINHMGNKGCCFKLSQTVVPFRVVLSTSLAVTPQGFRQEFFSTLSGDTRDWPLTVCFDAYPVQFDQQMY